MHIPRQSDRSRAPRGESLDGAAELPARRRHLIDQLRTVGYWQRLVRARTDLSVARLLYCAPVPTAVGYGSWFAGTIGDDADLAALATPPEGLDVEQLLGGAGPEGPGAQLDRLREVASVLVRRSHALQEELDVVTLALHASLARDGADREPDPTPGTDTTPDTAAEAARTSGHAALA